MKFVKFSKSYKNVLSLQKDYFKMNSLNLKTVVKINKKYLKQKKRTHCQNCLIKITKPFILNFGVKYSICNRCGHLNGQNKNTEKLYKLGIFQFLPEHIMTVNILNFTVKE